MFFEKFKAEVETYCLLVKFSTDYLSTQTKKRFLISILLL